jgi:hypothetical protein
MAILFKMYQQYKKNLLRSLYWLGKNMKKKDGYLQGNLNKNTMDGLYTIYFKRKTNTYNFSDWLMNIILILSRASKVSGHMSVC